MLPSAKKIKQTAKDILADNHFAGIIACMPIVFSLAIIMVLMGVVVSVTNIVIASFLSALLTLLLLIPLLLGTIRFLSRCVDGVCDYPSTVFWYFSSKKLYFKAMSFIVSLFGRLILSGVLISIPALIVSLFSLSEFYELIGIAIPLWTPILSTISSLMFIFSAIIFLVVNLKYYLYIYLFTVDEDITPHKALNISSVISRRTQIDFVYLTFSMIVYILLSLLFLPLIFTLPIIITVYIVHSKCAIIQYNSTIESINSNLNSEII